MNQGNIIETSLVAIKLSVNEVNDIEKLLIARENLTEIKFNYVTSGVTRSVYKIISAATVGTISFNIFVCSRSA